MKYLVNWLVTETVQDQCPDYKPDPYTGRYPNYHCAVNHTKQQTRSMDQLFETELEAKEFIKNAPEEIKKTMQLKEK